MVVANGLVGVALIQKERSIMKFTKTVVIGLIATLISACAGRTPNVVLATQAGDDGLGCQSLLEAMVFNTKEYEGLVKERNGDIAGNAAATVAGAFLLVPLLFLDTKNAASKEARGLIRRNQVLAERYRLKKCEPKIEDYRENKILLETDFYKAADANSPAAVK